jgi:membrane associated rhomboid family serine protease
MFIPLHDDTPLRMIRFQWVTGALMLVNLVIFLLTYVGSSEQSLYALAAAYGVVPLDVTAPGSIVPGPQEIPTPLTYVTYAFLHGGWLHLGVNMLFLWVFADNVEDAFGHGAFLLLYILCAIGAAVTHTLITPQSDMPLIGASGAVGGVLGAYLLLYPRARVWILLFMRLPIPIPALYVVLGWLALQFVSLYLSPPDEVSVAWGAHIGGFASGFLLTLVLRSQRMLGRAP